MMKRIVNEAEIGAIVTWLTQALPTGFVLWLEGEMGAGKTTLVKWFLRSKGLPESTPVVSPTYTIMNEYEINGHWYAHLDLYRAELGFSLDEIGVKDRVYEGVFIEWPEAPNDPEQTLTPSHQLKISYENQGDARGYQLNEIPK